MFGYSIKKLMGRAPQGARGLKSNAKGGIQPAIHVAPRKGRVG